MILRWMRCTRPLLVARLLREQKEKAVRTQRQKQRAFRENAEATFNHGAIRQQGPTLGIAKGIECRGSRRMESCRIMGAE
jgi:hypothetical protein